MPDQLLFSVQGRGAGSDRGGPGGQGSQYLQRSAEKRFPGCGYPADPWAFRSYLGSGRIERCGKCGGRVGGTGACKGLRLRGGA